MTASPRTLSTLEEVVVTVLDVSGDAARSGRDRVLIGIAGAPGAGKSTLSAALVSRLREHGERVAVLPMDGFHLSQRRLVELGRRDRMGAPDTFDVDGFVATLRRVRAGYGGETTAPGFDRTVEEAVPHAVTIAADTRIVVVEGNYLLLEIGSWVEVAALLDHAMVVEVARELRLERLVARHIRFGKSESDARAWALGPDDANARLVEQSAHRADSRVKLD
ncbi:nucleoside/nucleotide kinase family protein [Marisediminicola sp. LYQ85]|uniref:nucleoside/nucleotide kinase family protein n=1 Tax=Marisediminicola sp. LYQ85 TaxID=3391062 RepID=UPI00398309EF